MQNAIQLGAVCAHNGAFRHGRLHRDPHCTDGIGEISQGLARGHHQIERFDLQRLAAARCLGKREQIRHRCGKPLGFFPQNQHIIPCFGPKLLLFQQIEIADDAGERRFQIMRNIGDEIELHPLAFHLCVHTLLQMRTDMRHRLRGGMKAAFCRHANGCILAPCRNVDLRKQCIKTLYIAVRMPYQISAAQCHRKDREHGKCRIAPDAKPPGIAHPEQLIGKNQIRCDHKACHCAAHPKNAVYPCFSGLIV